MPRKSYGKYTVKKPAYQALHKALQEMVKEGILKKKTNIITSVSYESDKYRED